MKKSTLIGIIAGAAAFVALLLVATFFDLQISVALGDADSFFGQFFRLWGEFVGWVLIPIAGVILFGACTTDTKTGKTLKVFWGIVTVAGWYLTVNYLMGEFTGENYTETLYGSPYKLLTVYSALISLAVSGISFWFVSKIKKETLGKLVLFAAAIIFALAISQIVTTVLKNVWTRQRFRNMDIGNGGTDASGFTPWYVANLGKNKAAADNYVEDGAGMLFDDAYKSFPSGHTSAAALSFVVVLLPDIFEKLKKQKIWFYIVPAIFTVLVAVSRIVNRAHFLSDVLFGGTIGILSVCAAKGLVSLLKKANVKKKFFADFARISGVYEEKSAEIACAAEAAQNVGENGAEHAVKAAESADTIQKE